MSDNSANNKRIAKNTLALYFRMIITMFVGLFTSRVILDSLGIENYGIYNLVGGFVTMFNVFRAGLIAATQRFITFDLGKGDKNELRGTFSTSLIIFICISLLIIVIAETFAPWFIHNKLEIPENRMEAAMWVFQFSIFTLVLNLISSPYNALIIAHEKMKAFAYISIFEVFAKLAVAYVIYISMFDKLIVYAALLCFVQFIIRCIYNVYCSRHFEESKVLWKIDWYKIKKIYAFTGWELFGSVAVIGYTQGLNVLLGIFFSPVVNAARGVALQVQHVIVGFVSNFQTALNPQITKNYASGDKEYMYKLMFSSSRFSYFLLLFFSIPVMFEASTLLNIWLVEVPQYTVVFFRLIIAISMIDAMSNPIITSVEATGNIRKYQVIVGGILLLVVPIAYIVLKLGGEPYSVFVVHLSMAFCAFCARIYMGSRAVGFSVKRFEKSVIVPVIVVTGMSMLIPGLLHFYMEEGVLRLFLVCFVSVFSTGLLVYKFGLADSERNLVMSYINKYKSK